MYFKVVNGAVSINNESILESVNMEIKDHEHIGIVGRNGAGKSTLLKAIIHPDLFESGVAEEKFGVMSSNDFKVGYLKQNEGLFSKHTLLDEILEVYRPILDVYAKIKKLEEKLESGTSSLEDANRYVELEDTFKNMGGYEYKKEYLMALTKNGFTEDDLERPISSFSGGEQTKICFIKLVLSKPDLLLLDEPTNHLDIAGVLWLEEYLRNYPKTFVVVSHDRMFLNRVVNKIYEIEFGEVQVYHGNYEYYEREKKKRREIELNNYVRVQKEIERLERIVERFRYKPSKARMAMSKLKQIEKLSKTRAPKEEDYRTFHYRFSNFQESGKVVLNVNHLQFGYDKVLGEANFSLSKGRRLGIVGQNGTGKSTLLKTIVGLIPALSGNFEFGFHVQVAYFDQNFLQLNAQLTVYEEFQEKFPFKNDFEIRSALASFLFFKEDIDKKIEVLSGGEKVRLALCEVVYREANFLILDEPTNHLDILSKEKLEDVLASYPGTILFVSHDRYFIKKMADSILDFDHHQVTYYDYDYESYLEKKKENMEIKEEKVVKKEKKKQSKNKNTDAINKKITKLERELHDLNEQLYLEEVYTNLEKYQERLEKIKNKEDELNELLMR